MENVGVVAVIGDHGYLFVSKPDKDNIEKQWPPSTPPKTTAGGMAASLASPARDISDNENPQLQER